MFMPTHSIFIYYKDGSYENVCICDCSNKQEVIEEIKSIQKYHNKSIEQHGGFLRYEYKDARNRTIHIISYDELV